MFYFMNSSLTKLSGEVGRDRLLSLLLLDTLVPVSFASISLFVFKITFVLVFTYVL